MVIAPATSVFHRFLRHALVILLVAASYFGLALITFMLPVMNKTEQMVTVAIWPASALAFTAYWRYGWPAIIGALIGALLMYSRIGSGLNMAMILVAIVNVLPPVLSRWLLLRSGTTELFGSIGAVLRYSIYAGVIAPIINAVLSVSILFVYGHLAPEHMAATGLLWWASEALAMLLVAPALLAWRDWKTMNTRQVCELSVLLTVVLIAHWQLFIVHTLALALPLSMLLMPLIYTALFRFNFGVMAGVSLLISILSIRATSSAQFVARTQEEQFFYLLSFLAMLALINIVMCSVLATARRTFARLTASEEHFRAVFEQAAVGIVIRDMHPERHVVNRTLANMLGYSEAELKLLNERDLVLPSDLEISEKHAEQLFSGTCNSLYYELRYRHRDGHTLWIAVTLSLVRSTLNNADFVVGLFQDVTARKTAEADAERLALYDYLTGLPNRRLFGDRLNNAVLSARRSGNYGALIYVDLDNFKNLNDAHGHSAGDDMLTMVAARLQKTLREEDTIARLGGDEFVILLQNVSASLDTATDAVWLIAQKILQSFHEPFTLASNIEFFVTASIGVTLFPKAHETAEELLKEADIAMYRVKDEQRNAIRFYAPEMKEEANLRVSLERDLRHALQREEFKLFLQPQFDAERHMVGAEVLLRWSQRDGKMISPVTFIPVAEETGLIVPLGEWVLSGAAKMIRQLELVSQDISLSVNVSPRQFQEANFVERVRTLLWENGADPGRLILEITEGLVVADFDDAHTKISQLKGMGIRLSIDDFGTGHSSLAYLKRLPLHELKIDRAFIKDLPHDRNDAALVEAILAMSGHLQLEVVAEGVETAEQFEFLKQRGCHRYQGFYFGHAQTPETYFDCFRTEPLPQYRVE
ncbi:MAG: hypothetical protein JWM78_2430 [Verrucomicrobiaceae bacterium]|nr:hypothetical protein [Verrucomicrobiaceae bacterium]